MLRTSYWHQVLNTGDQQTALLLTLVQTCFRTLRHVRRPAELAAGQHSVSGNVRHGILHMYVFATNVQLDWGKHMADWIVVGKNVSDIHLQMRRKVMEMQAFWAIFWLISLCCEMPCQRSRIAEVHSTIGHTTEPGLHWNTRKQHATASLTGCLSPSPNFGIVGIAYQKHEVFCNHLLLSLGCNNVTIVQHHALNLASWVHAPMLASPFALSPALSCYQTTFTKVCIVPWSWFHRSIQHGMRFFQACWSDDDLGHNSHVSPCWRLWSHFVKLLAWSEAAYQIRPSIARSCIYRRGYELTKYSCIPTPRSRYWMKPRSKVSLKYQAGTCWFAAAAAGAPG